MKMELRRRAIDKIFKRRDRYDIPVWQRDEVWPREKERLLIDTILRGWHLPKFYFVKVSGAPEGWEVVDGQQRLAAIFSFLDGTLSLAAESQAEFGGPFYKDLASDVSDRFDDYELDYEEITDAEDGQIQQYFSRLQEGMPLTPAEKLNSVPGKLTDYIRKLSKHAFFQKKVALKDTRYAYFDVSSKVVALEIQGIDAGLRYDELQDLLKTNAKFSGTSAAAKRVAGALGYLNKHVFKEESDILRNRSMVQSIVTLTARLQRAGLKVADAPRIKNFITQFASDLQAEIEKGHQATDKDLLEFQSTISANIKTGPGIRQAVLLRRLLMFDKDMDSIVNPGVVSEVSTGLNLEGLASDIQQSVYALNKVHQGTHGKDMFKSTTETTKALSTLGQTTWDLGAYKSMIDGLYFILWEGTGSGKRLGDPILQFAKDVNDLRTQVRHDVDHGGKSKAASKMKSLGKTFSKFASGTSPEALSNDAFPLAQMRILTTVRQGLSDLLSVS